ncbi:MAG: hypothetical protein RMJ28_02400 [Nitrososphaerota archaeon]|nr:hypothetical protein [Candidatus Calditenuaceae archaeon]MDW8073073.1 hypothetical protein [Nitrososphaerota archaeon]
MLAPNILSSNRILVVGESRSGKTRLLHRLVWILAEAGYSNEVTIIDMAPSLSWGVGGKIIEVGEVPEGVRYLTSWEIKPPRLIGRDAEEVQKLARDNCMLLNPLIERYVKNPTPILAINDATIFVHGGESAPLTSAMALSRAWIVTAYSGSRLAEDKGSGLTLRERRFVESLLQVSDIIIRMG